MGGFAVRRSTAAGCAHTGTCENARARRAFFMPVGRGDRIRTCDFYLPKVALYQAELHPDGKAAHDNGCAAPAARAGHFW